MGFWSLVCLRVMALELNHCTYPRALLSGRSKVASLTLITRIRFAAGRLAFLCVSSGCGLSELLTDVNMHIVSTELGIDGGVDIPSSFTTGIMEIRP
jgi:hypothetical protein